MIYSQIILNAAYRALECRRAYLANPNPGTLGGYRDRRKAFLRLRAKARREAGRPDLRGIVRTQAETRQRNAETRRDRRWRSHYDGACAL
jgi:hypothetical protein